MEDATAIIREADSQLDVGTMSAACWRERGKNKDGDISSRAQRQPS